MLFGHLVDVFHLHHVLHAIHVLPTYSMFSQLTQCSPDLLHVLPCGMAGALIEGSHLEGFALYYI